MTLLRRLAILVQQSLLIACVVASYTTAATATSGTIQVLLPKYRLSANEIGVIVNDRDPLSVRIGAYYQQARGVPAQNVVHVAFRPDRSVMSRKDFGRIKARVDSQTPSQVQAYAVTWAAPYRVECISLTTAFAFGFDPAFCSSGRCARTRPSPLFRRFSAAPWSDFGVRPTMAVAAKTFAAAKALIDRGIQSDNSWPSGTAHLVITGDKARDVRSSGFAQIQQRMRNWIDTRIEHGTGLRDTAGVLFYFTGARQVPFLDTLEFVPGAIADHLTSGGGKLTNSRQMSALRWLEAGATGSYGTVIEPCNHLGKFPDPGLVMESYGAGRTLLEAYWQSVQQPGEGIFIGEPLAAPFGGYTASVRENDILLTTHSLLPGTYRVSVSVDPVGPYRESALLTAGYHQKSFVLPKLDAEYYRLEPVPASALHRSRRQFPQRNVMKPRQQQQRGSGAEHRQ